MRIFSIFSIILPIVAWPALAYSQDFGICERLASRGLIDTRDVNIFREQASEDFDYVCSQKENRVGRASQRSGGGTVGWGGFTLGMSGAKGESSTSEQIDNICSNGKETFLQRISETESIKSGQAVVAMVENCLRIVADSESETLFGFVRPSISSDKAFTVKIFYNPPKDSLKKLIFSRIEADPVAEVTCLEGGKPLQDKEISQQTAFSCTKKEGVAVNGEIMLRASDTGSERAISFQVSSPIGTELIREALKEETELKINSVSSEFTQAIDQINQKISELKKITPVLECVTQGAIAGPHNGHHIEVKSPELTKEQMEEGWRITGGSCSIFDVDSGGQTYISDLELADNGTAFFCDADHVPNVATTRKIMVSAILCRVTQK